MQIEGKTELNRPMIEGKISPCTSPPKPPDDDEGHRRNDTALTDTTGLYSFSVGAQSLATERRCVILIHVEIDCHLSEHKLLHLTCSRLWDSTEYEMLWHLKACKMLAAEKSHRGSIDLHSIAELEECTRHFSPTLVRLCDDGRNADSGVAVQHLFDLHRRDILASRDNNILRSVCDAEWLLSRKMRIPGSSRAVFRFDRAQHSDVISRSIPI
ncbi:hypothetical protein [Sphingopyxis flava]|uniref:Uncharacterized protein n=1 Tax=Sphingopyxis flava TaxID=1507287 RepID=A0A1T5EGU0_9SPHN|nr:hypothetical protein SAMN06295937_10221 [Sphingopyxis flava]